jgi:TonB family protein
MPKRISGGHMHSLNWHSRSFFLFLLAVVLLHGSFLAVQLRDQFNYPEITATETIKLKLIQEALQSPNKQQIVQSEDSASLVKPKDAAFLSDKDRHFDRETVSKNIDSFKRAAKGNASTTQSAQTAPETVQKKKSSWKDLKLSDVGMAQGEPLPKKMNRAPASVKGMENGDPNSQGLSASNDYVEEVTLGDFTHLNTVEFKHYGFFHRIRQKLEQFWGRSIQEKANSLMQQGRRLPATEDLITSLQISLNAKGEIIDVKILGTSGVKELDDAAIESFNQAGPFPNPPKDLLVNGRAVIEWGFVVKS